MPNFRGFLVIALLVTGYFLWDAWQRQFNPVVSTASVAATPGLAGDAPQSTRAQLPDAEVPRGPAPPAAAPAPAADSMVPDAPRVLVETDLLRVTLDTRGGSVVGAELLHYPVDPKRKNEPVALLSDNGERFFVAQVGLVGSQGAAPDHRALFQTTRARYQLGAERRLEVPLVWEDPSGVRVTRTYVFERGSYVVEVRTQIHNQSAAPWSGSEYRQLQRTSPLVNRKFSFTNPEQYSFVGASWYSPEGKYEKLAFEDFGEQALSRSFSGGWAALQQHYFFAAWIPPAHENAQYTTQVVTANGPPRYLIRAMAPSMQVPPGGSATTGARLYVGPKLQDHLEQVAPGLRYTVDYGKVTLVAQPLFWLLEWLHRLTGNWGIAIILLTILIKLAFFKLTEAQYKSFARMRKLTPRMQALKERYGDDRQKLNQAMMELYQKEKINPLGGCLPMLVQIPVFIALYWVLLESVELRQAPFLGWIQNLSDKDPYFILPVLNALAMVAAQRLTPTTGMDPMQAKVMQLMPIVFGISFAFFPAGLVLYWTVNGVLSLAQQWVITKRIEASEKS